MSINSRCGRTDTAVRAGIAARLAEMQERADNATDGPWHSNHCKKGRGQKVMKADGVTLFFNERKGQARARIDAEFIAHARSDVPALVNAVESVLDYVGRCEESGITMQPGDVRSLIAAALGGAS